MSFEICPEAPTPEFDLAINRPDIPLTAFLGVVEEQRSHWTSILRDTMQDPTSIVYAMARRFHNFLDGVIIQETNPQFGANRTLRRIEEDRRVGLGHSALSMLVRAIVPDPRQVSDARGKGFAGIVLDDLPGSPLSQPQMSARLHIAPENLPQGLFPPLDKTEDWYRLTDERGRPTLFVHYWNIAQTTSKTPKQLEERGVWAESLAAHVTFIPYIPTRTPLQRR